MHSLSKNDPEPEETDEGEYESEGEHRRPMPAVNAMSFRDCVCAGSAAKQG